MPVVSPFRPDITLENVQLKDYSKGFECENAHGTSRKCAWRPLLFLWCEGGELTQAPLLLLVDDVSPDACLSK